MSVSGAEASTFDPALPIASRAVEHVERVDLMARIERAEAECLELRHLLGVALLDLARTETAA